MRESPQVAANLQFSSVADWAVSKWLASGNHTSIDMNTLLLVTDGSNSRQLPLDHFPFTLGRLEDRDCVVGHQATSREHAILLQENGGCYVEDCASRYGTFVNGEKVDRRLLRIGDAIQLGSLEAPVLRFCEEGEETQKPGSILPDLKAIGQPASDLERLKWFLDAARKLNEFGAINEILGSLVEITLQLTKVERGFVFLTKSDGELEFAVGRGISGPINQEDHEISRSAIQQAIRGASKFIVTDTMSAESDFRSESIVAQSIRFVICIPLRRRSAECDPTARETMGVLYLDSRLNVGSMTSVEHDLLETIAKEAAALVENAYLAESEAAARRYRTELAIASAIQHGLMKVRVPKLPYVQISAQSIPCLEIGGDFYDVIEAHGCLYVIVADISGKGISAALLASTLQGMLYAMVKAGQPLTQIASVANQFIAEKDVGKYATMVMVKVTKRGLVEYINCGHVRPVVVNGAEVSRLQETNLPVGLIPNAVYESDVYQLNVGGRLLLVTDGITEAENPAGDFYGEEELERSAVLATVKEVFDQVQIFANGAPSSDDCTIVEVRYTSA